MKESRLKDRSRRRRCQKFLRECKGFFLTEMRVDKGSTRPKRSCYNADALSFGLPELCLRDFLGWRAFMRLKP